MTIDPHSRWLWKRGPGGRSWPSVPRWLVLLTQELYRAGYEARRRAEAMPLGQRTLRAQRIKSAEVYLRTVDRAFAIAVERT